MSAVQPSGFYIDKISFKKFLFEILSFSLFENENLNLENGIAYATIKKENEENRLFILALTIDAKNNKTNEVIFKFDIELLGKFIFAHGYDSKIANNAIAIMYSYIRPMVAQFTTLSGLPPLNLEPLNFSKIEIEEIDENDTTIN